MWACFRVVLTRIVVLICLLTRGAAFANHGSLQRVLGRHRAERRSTQLHLVPIANFHNDIGFLSASDDYRCCLDSDGRFQADDGEIYELCLVEETDLPDLSRFVVEAFGADAIKLSQDMNALERLLMQPAVELVNGYSGIVAFAEVLAGIRSRLKDRIGDDKTMDLSPPKLQGLSRSEKLDVASGTALVLALAKPVPGSDWHIDPIASVELRLQPCDAKIPFTLPWLDKIERRLASLIGMDKNAGRDLQPYLSNLCVDEKYRGKGIGRALVRCLENIVTDSWGYKRMYLHVDFDNEPAMELYRSEGYRDVGRRWNPFWAGKAAEIGYFLKHLDRNEPSTTKVSVSEKQNI